MQIRSTSRPAVTRTQRLAGPCRARLTSCCRRHMPDGRWLGRAALDSDVSIAHLEAELQGALAQEDYKLAARLRDEIQQKQQVSKLAVEDANRRFYDAFMSGRVEEMERVVGEGEHVQVVHPGASCIAGRAQVMDSWRAILRNVRPGAFKVKLEDVRVFAQEDMGFVTCVEIIDADDSEGRIVATNVFEKQGGVWRIIQHHGSPTIARFR
ncbi:hypothetical protein Vretimale_12340 [Volvox reticuliferus]|uniref:UVR domain-containing protein n=1 Tax=Volvox reticuliferus TaxID=1737510 RepID=A0A8J4LRT0_9CHLO|nr:hypothetical protein Vretifemale_8949 [Volvox reticuliferus]GIM08261.1 hypothetical protein Vretimale_12340 [Volvox reticuliferus]